MAAIAIPRLGGFTDKAEEKADIANAKLLDSAIQMHYADDGTYPAGTMAGANPTAAEVTALEGVLQTADLLPANSNIVFNDLTKLVFTIDTGKVTAVTYTP
ncbi:type II secretory pathway pseudopilin PulG [Fusibacter tunisiensis]|uniref:Type II secretory pathway pseudopilin PulG n=1 Tax=Fusibacter tunisiensis TaxID=1008308 RepID=A0ABS2MPZ4_9FIRM|nr:type II secretory pathway pseudopilin PulG [Fusibacter tunisiensis]